MVKQISLHAASNAERSAYGSKYGNNHLQDSFPNFLFHFLFPFFFLMVQQSVFLVVNSAYLWTTMQRKCKREQSQACLNFAECSLSSNTVQRYNIFLWKTIVVPNHVHPCPESRAFLPHIHSLPPNLTAINLMTIKLNVKSVNIIWHVLPFQLRGDAAWAASPRIARCVGT